MSFQIFILCVTIESLSITLNYIYVFVLQCFLQFSITWYFKIDTEVC